MRRLLLTSLICCAFVVGCGGTDDPADSDCVGDECGSDNAEGDQSGSGDDAPADDGVADDDPAGAPSDDTTDDQDLEPDDDVDTDLVVTAVAEAWGIDEDLARCVVEELSLDDPAAIDPDAIDDPTKEICGTSLLELMVAAG